MNVHLAPRPFVRRGTPAHTRGGSRETAGGPAAGRLGPLLYLLPGYLLLLAAAEALALRAAPDLPALGPILYGLILALLLLHAALCWDSPLRGLPLTLSLAPLARLLLFWPAVQRLPGVAYGLALGLPLLAVVVAAVNLALPLGRAAGAVREGARRATAGPAVQDRPGLPRHGVVETSGAVPRRGPGRPDPALKPMAAGRRLPPRLAAAVRCAIVSMGGALAAVWARRRDWRVVQLGRTAWARRRDWRVVQLGRTAWARRRDWRVVQLGRTAWARWRELRVAAFVQAVWARRPALGERVAARLGPWGQVVRQAVGPLALRGAARVGDGWRSLVLRLRVLARALSRRAPVSWGGVVGAALLILLLTAWGVASTVTARAAASGRPAGLSAVGTGMLGGWGGGLLVEGSGAAAGLPRAAEAPPAAPEATAAPTPTAGAAARTAARPRSADAVTRPPLVVTPAGRPADAEVFAVTPLPTLTPTPLPTSTPTPTPVPRPPAQAPAAAPVFPNGCPGGGYGNAYPWGVCTWYAKAKRPDLPWFRGDYGMADNWGTAARACGFVVDTEPAPGAVLVFSPYANGASSRGHVGYVEEVGADYVLISECNAGFDSLYAEAPFWWEAGYPCIRRRIPRYALSSGIEYIHGRVEVGAP